MKTRYLLGLPFATVKINGKEIEVIVDTGFNGSLMLPLELVKELELKRAGLAQYAMADGTISEAAIFVAELDWFGSKKEVTVVSSSSEFPLMGMELLYYCKMIFHPSKNILTIEQDE